MLNFLCTAAQHVQGMLFHDFAVTSAQKLVPSLKNVFHTSREALVHDGLRLVCMRMTLNVNIPI